MKKFIAKYKYLTCLSS